MVDQLQIPLGPYQECLLAIPTDTELGWYPGQTVYQDGERVWLQVAPATAEALVKSGVAETTIETWRAGDARYLLQAQIESVELIPQPCIGARILHAHRIQRRKFFRIEGTLMLEHAAVIDSAGGSFPLDAVLRDVSAGGVGARVCAGLRASTSPVPITIGTPLVITLRLPEEKALLELDAQVVRVQEASNGRSGGCEIGAAFWEVPTRVQERLIHCILRAQHEQARRGLL